MLLNKTANGFCCYIQAYDKEKKHILQVQTELYKASEWLYLARQITVLVLARQMIRKQTFYKAS